MFTASTFSSNATTRDLLVSMVHSRASYNQTTGAFPTLYDVDTGNSSTGQARWIGFHSLVCLFADFDLIALLKERCLRCCRSSKESTLWQRTTADYTAKPQPRKSHDNDTAAAAAHTFGIKDKPKCGGYRRRRYWYYSAPGSFGGTWYTLLAQTEEISTCWRNSNHAYSIPSSIILEPAFYSCWCG